MARYNEKTRIPIQQVRDIAQAVRLFAEQYESTANSMELRGIQAVDCRNFDSLKTGTKKIQAHLAALTEALSEAVLRSAKLTESLPTAVANVSAQSLPEPPAAASARAHEKKWHPKAPDPVGLENDVAIEIWNRCTNTVNVFADITPCWGDSGAMLRKAFA